MARLNKGPDMPELRFHQALTQNSALPVTLTDARMSAELLTALYHAGRMETAVTFPILPDHPLYHGWQP